MNKITISTLIVAAFAVAISPLPSAQAQAQETTDQRLIVTFKNRPSDQDVSNIKGAGAAAVKRLDLVNSIVVTVPTQAVINKLKGLHNVERIENDAIAHVVAPPVKETTIVTQPLQSVPWGVNRIDAPKSWAASRGTGVKVAVIDTGIDKSHPDLIDSIAGGVNFVQAGRGPRATVDPAAWNDDNGHGTHVSGTVAASDNTIGVVGVAPQARLYGVKALNSAGSGYVSDIISGIEWSVGNSMQVISMSLTLTSDVQALHDAVDTANNAGVVVVAASGNSGDGNAATNNVGYPGKYTSAIAVSATDNSDRIATFSSDGAEVEIAAPGVNIYSTARGGSYSTMSGTSMATPHVAGVIANMLAAPVIAAADLNGDGLWSAGEVRSYLQTTSDDLGTVGRDVFYGYGLVDTEEAVSGIQTQ
jgi:subtilisin family serine protease